MNSLLLRQIARPGLQQVRNASRGPEAVSTLKTFKLMSYIGVPAAVLLVGYNAWRIESDHVNHHQRPEYKAYSHMGLRSKAFPWGDGNHSLFHNPKRNAVPGVGYEED